MNELQQVLVVFAVIVILGLYFLQKNKNNKSASSSSRVAHPSKNEASRALNELGEPHIPVDEVTSQRLHVEPSINEVAENQGQLPFEDVSVASESLSEDRKPKQVVIETEEVDRVADFSPEMKSVDGIPSFGRPENMNDSSEAPKAAEAKEPQVFALIVMCTEAAYNLTQIKQALLGVGLTPSEAGIFVKKDSMGNDLIKVANLMEPGLFPLGEDESFSTQGIVMILELPTTVKAPAVMHDLIMMARKISQRLNGRIYNIERQLIKESDLQAMREAAVAYESDAL